MPARCISGSLHVRELHPQRPPCRGLQECAARRVRVSCLAPPEPRAADTRSRQAVASARTCCSCDEAAIGRDPPRAARRCQHGGRGAAVRRATCRTACRERAAVGVGSDCLTEGRARGCDAGTGSATVAARPNARSRSLNDTAFGSSLAIWQQLLHVVVY